MLTDIERIKRYVLNYSISGDEAFIAPIESLFGSFEKVEFSDESQEYQHNYRQLLKNIEKFQKDFEGAKKSISLHFELHKQLRFSAQKLEESIELSKYKSSSQNELMELILFRKSILEIEKGVIRYFETDNALYISQVMKEFDKAFEYVDNVKWDAKLRDDLEKKSQSLKAFANRVIQHYRTYSMMTKVVIPGDAFEINFYSKKLKEIILHRVEFTTQEISEYTELSKKISIVSGVLITFFVIVDFLFIIQITLEPLKQLTQMFEKLSKGDEELEIPEYKFDDELGKLLKAANHYKEVNRQTKELLAQTQDYKENLEKRVVEEITIRREREKALVQQSKLASMGEMIGAIAHQWRQPLNELGIRIQKLKYNYAKDEIDEEFIQNFIEKNKETINFMSRTIDDFRNFFRIDKVRKSFNVQEAIIEVLNIQKAQLKNHNIEVDFVGNTFSLNSYKTEFQQVIINIISNAKDALVKNKIQNPKISVEIAGEKIVVLDNGGGIPKALIERVFEPYFTTKDQGEGTGMGLYMSKMIIEENMGGKISASNVADGAKIIIDLSGIQ